MTQILARNPVYLLGENLIDENFANFHKYFALLSHWKVDQSIIPENREFGVKLTKTIDWNDGL